MNYSDISCNDARDLVHKGAQLVDVRDPQEFSLGALPEAANLPLSFLPMAVTQLDRERPVVVYCASGLRSAQAAQWLKARGFRDVYNLGPYSNYLNC